jgi:hypothetical protein
MQQQYKRTRHVKEYTYIVFISSGPSLNYCAQISNNFWTKTYS